jgi:uncharacterized protein (DUF342 family)
VSGANLEVEGGIIGKRQKTVRTGGSLQARFLDNALVDAAGDVSVQHSVMRSMIRAKGAVQVMGGKGCLIGGSVVADRGVVVNELGSRGAVKTLVEVGTNEEAMAAFARYEKEVDFARRNERKTKRHLAALVKKGKAVNRAGKQAAKVHALKARLVKFRRSTKERRDMLSRCRKRVALAMNQREDGNAGVTVKKAVFRGAMVTVNGYTLQVNEDIPKGGTFVLDTESWTIRYMD